MTGWWLLFTIFYIILLRKPGDHLWVIIARMGTAVCTKCIRQFINTTAKGHCFSQERQTKRLEWAIPQFCQQYTSILLITHQYWLGLRSYDLGHMMFRIRIYIYIIISRWKTDIFILLSPTLQTNFLSFTSGTAKNRPAEHNIVADFWRFVPIHSVDIEIFHWKCISN